MERDRRPRGPLARARATIRRIPPTPPRHPFPESDAPPESAPPEISRVTRRRESAPPAREVSLDEFDFLEPASARIASWAPTVPRPESLPPPLPPEARAPARVEPVVPPLPVPTFEAPRPSRPQTPPSSRPNRRRVWMAAGGAALAVLTLSFRMGMLVSDGHRSPVAAPPSAAPETQPSPEAPRPTETTPSPKSVPVVDVAALPKARLGTVIGASGHRLWVDGKLAETWTAIVNCGPHEVQVGSAGTPHTVQVPCGEEIAVSP
jgi:hypothetical protein